MALPQVKPARYEDLFALPENLVWWILDEPELHLGDDILVPDIAGWRRERMPTLPDAVWFELAPDWVCEILSPSTARIDRVEKLPIYAANGCCWRFLNTRLPSLRPRLTRSASTSAGCG